MRVATVALLSLLVSCKQFPGAKLFAGGESASNPGSCAAVATHLSAFDDILESTSGDARVHVLTYAGLLELLLSFETAAQDLENDLGSVPPKGDLEKPLHDAHAVLERSVQFARGERDAVEKHATEIAPLAKEAQKAWAALRSVCDPKHRGAPRDCKSVQASLAKFDSAETPADHEKALAELAMLKVAAPIAKSRDRALQGSKAVQSAIKTRVDALAPVPKRWASLQKDLGSAMEALAAPCKGTDTLLDRQLVAAERPDPRKLTVLVHVKPPAGIEKSLLALSNASKDEDEKAFYKARAEGAFGSGFFLVKKTDKGNEVLVVTNRHVIDLGDRAGLELADGTSLGTADVIYASPVHDLAVLRPATKLSVTEGFSFAKTPAKDQQVVIATGFPGLDSRPSYQTTRGYVSNESFKFDDGARPLHYVQHTAPIDPGSSGGPLTDEAGHVLGVNTLKVMGRDSVGLAVPSRFVIDTLRTAALIDAQHALPAVRQRSARLACLGFVAELGTAEPRLPVLEQMISNRLVGASGLDDAMALAGEQEFEELWNQDSVRAMRIATLVRLRSAFMGGGGPSVLETCDDLDQGSAKADSVKYRVRLGNFETRDLALRWEHGRWKIDGVSAAQEAPRKGAKKLPPPGPPPAAPPAPKKVVPPNRK
jgi:serine protease Do